METMKVLHIVSSLWSGGVAVLLKNYYECMNHDLVQFDFLVTCPEKGMTEHYFESQGCRIYHLKGHKHYFDTFFSTIRIVRNGNYKIVHVHHNEVSFLQLLAARLGGAKVRIAHSHDVLYLKGVKRVLRKAYCVLTRIASNYHFACSKDAGEYLFGKKGVKKKNYICLHNAIDYSRFQYSEEKRADVRARYHCGDSFIVGNVGRLCDQKNQKFILEIFCSLLKKREDSFLFLIGKGEDHDEIEKRIGKLGIENKVFLVEVTDRIDEYLSSFDVFLFPSKHEGLGIAFLEAQAANMPCVISDRVPKEAIVCESRVTVLSLDEKADTWAKALLQYDGITRNENVTSLFMKHYDIQNEASNLQKWYIEHTKQRFFCETRGR